MNESVFYVVVIDQDTRKECEFEGGKHYPVLRVENLKIVKETSTGYILEVPSNKSATYFLIPNRNGKFYWIWSGHCHYREDE